MFTNNLIVSVQYISVKPSPPGRNPQRTTLGSHSQPCSQWQLHLCLLILKAFPNFTMLPKDDKKKKDARMSAKKGKDPVNKSGGEAKKKKWSKGRVQDKLNNLV